LLAECVTVRVAAALPAVFGAYATTIVQLVAPAMVPVPVGHVPPVRTNGAGSTRLVTESCAFWTFLSVTVFDVLVLPSTTLPNDRLVGESVTGTTPVPVSGAVSGLPG
jgi:hypothetical protein